MKNPLEDRLTYDYATVGMPGKRPYEPIYPKDPVPRWPNMAGMERVVSGLTAPH